MRALASDEMHGRGSATADELIAAQYIASQLKLLKIEPAGEEGGYLQTVKFARRSRNAPEAAPKESSTTNVVGILRGSDPKLAKETILLSAHLDHLGIGREVAGDNIYNGADDDASGVTAVLELAAALAAGPRPKRTVVFALFGSEEIGGYGARYFQEHPPVPVESFVANLEFEMIGRPDAAVAAHTLWLTGYERSNLGAELAAHGARLVADPHPEQHFFQRSDNYVLARKGIIAHTVSSYGLHADYHRPSDDLAHIDFAHMTDSIESMVEPVRWLLNTDFKPQWSKDGKP
jgi:Zn-dependent M28 family amino/carboxypeptidase